MDCTLVTFELGVLFSGLGCSGLNIHNIFSKQLNCYGEETLR